MGDSVNLMVKRGVQADPRSWNNPVTPMMTEWSTQVSVDNESAKYCSDSFSLFGAQTR